MVTKTAIDPQIREFIKRIDLGIAGIIAEKYSIPVLDLGCTVNDCKNAADVLVMAKGKTAGYPMLLKVSAT